MRMVAMFVLVGVLAVWGFFLNREAAQLQRMEEGVRILALSKFKPFLKPWFEEHQDEFEREFIVEYNHAARFRMRVKQFSQDYAGCFVDAFGGSATRLRKQERLRAFLGGPLKLLVSTRLSDAKGGLALADAWSRLNARVIGIAPMDTALGLDTQSWFVDEQVPFELDQQSDSSEPRLKEFASTAELIAALTDGQCDAVILRADLQDPPGTTVWSWHRLSGIPAENYAMGLILLQENQHGESLRELWQKMQPDFEAFRMLREAEIAQGLAAEKSAAEGTTEGDGIDGKALGGKQ